jgi:hypothetical protein
VASDSDTDFALVRWPASGSGSDSEAPPEPKRAQSWGARHTEWAMPTGGQVLTMAQWKQRGTQRSRGSQGSQGSQESRGRPRTPPPPVTDVGSHMAPILEEMEVAVRRAESQEFHFSLAPSNALELHNVGVDRPSHGQVIYTSNLLFAMHFRRRK